MAMKFDPLTTRYRVINRKRKWNEQNGFLVSIFYYLKPFQDEDFPRLIGRDASPRILLWYVPSLFL